MDGGEGWRRHSPNGSHDHVYPDGKIRSHDTITTETNIGESILIGGVSVGAGYLIYRGVRMIPSLIPYLWWTIPENAVCP